MKFFNDNGRKFLPVKQNLVDQLWVGKPALPAKPVSEKIFETNEKINCMKIFRFMFMKKSFAVTLHLIKPIWFIPI